MAKIPVRTLLTGFRYIWFGGPRTRLLFIRSVEFAEWGMAYKAGGQRVKLALKVFLMLSRAADRIEGPLVRWWTNVKSFRDRWFWFPFGGWIPFPIPIHISIQSRIQAMWNSICMRFFPSLRIKTEAEKQAQRELEASRSWGAPQVLVQAYSWGTWGASVSTSALGVLVNYNRLYGTQEVITTCSAEKTGPSEDSETDIWYWPSGGLY
ncbi:hypothetical protein L218DRAFT_678126 [Marasmius fiardii PR-910]|nr:hypothetical protein L218DRAFT_678126 [Marasmius fiardii PR-910]